MPYVSLIQLVWHYGKPWRLSIVGYYVAFAVAQLFMSLGPYALGKTIHALSQVNEEGLFPVFKGLAMLVASTLLFWVFHGPARCVERVVALKIQQAFRQHWYDQLLKLPLSWHQNHHSGNTITRIHRASLALYQFAERQFTYIEALVQLTVALCFLFWVSVKIGCLSLCVAFFVAGVILLFDRKLVPLYDQENEQDNQVGSVFFDYVSNMTTILTLRLGSLTSQHFFQRMQTVWPIFRKEIVWNEGKWFVMMVVMVLLQAVVLGGYIADHVHTVSGAILLSSLIMVFRYQQELTRFFFEFSFHYGELVRLNQDVQGVQVLVQSFCGVPSRFLTESIDFSIQPDWQALTIRALHFQYPTEAGGKGSRGGLHQVTFSLKRGEKVALIGPSGGGKSTLLKVLAGLYDPSEVELQMDQASFFSLRPLQECVSLVPQDPEIFENTLLFNLTLGLPVPEEDIQKMLDLACFSEVLAHLPQGLNTDIREKGLNFSVGQKQRLALARGLFAARYHSLILMDEPTSSLDLATEKKIFSGLLQAFPRTTLVISLHRLHLLPLFDQVLFLDQGRCLAAGSVASLLQEPGPVKNFWEVATSAALQSFPKAIDEGGIF